NLARPRNVSGSRVYLVREISAEKIALSATRLIETRIAGGRRGITVPVGTHAVKLRAAISPTVGRGRLRISRIVLAHVRGIHEGLVNTVCVVTPYERHAARDELKGKRRIIRTVAARRRANR